METKENLAKARKDIGRARKAIKKTVPFYKPLARHDLLKKFDELIEYAAEENPDVRDPKFYEIYIKKIATSIEMATRAGSETVDKMMDVLDKYTNTYLFASPIILERIAHNVGGMAAREGDERAARLIDIYKSEDFRMLMARSASCAFTLTFHDIDEIKASKHLLEMSSNLGDHLQEYKNPEKLCTLAHELLQGNWVLEQQPAVRLALGNDLESYVYEEFKDILKSGYKLDRLRSASPLGSLIGEMVRSSDREQESFLLCLKREKQFIRSLDQEAMAPLTCILYSIGGGTEAYLSSSYKEPADKLKSIITEHPMLTNYLTTAWGIAKNNECLSEFYEGFKEVLKKNPEHLVKWAGTIVKDFSNDESYVTNALEGVISDGA